MKKVFDQTFRDIKREVNKKVLKVPGIEQKVLDATSNEPWGPHGTLLADIAQATRNYHEYQMIMAVIWKRINDTGKNWRHVYKALTVLEYLVAHGSERVIDDIREHSYQISTLSDFQYIDSSGRDQGNNVRKKSQSLVALVNDKERIIEVRQKAAANRDKFRNTSAGGMYRPGSYSSSGGYGDRNDYDRYEGRYGNRDDDQNGYGREREYGYRDDDRYGRNGDSYGRDGDRYGRDYEDRYGRDTYRDYDYRGRSRSVDGYQDGSSRNSDRNHALDDESHQVTRQMERKFSEQNLGAPPSYEEALSESRSPVHSERDGEGSAPAAPRASSPPAPRASSPPAPPETSSSPAAPGVSSPAAPGSSSPHSNQHPIQATNSFGNSTSVKQEVVASDEFDPRGSLPASAATSTNAAPTTSNGPEMDLLGSLSDSFSSNSLAIMPAEPATSTVEADAFANSGSTSTFSATQSASNVMNQTFEDPFGDSPFKAIPSTDTAPVQQQTSASTAPFQPNLNQNAEIPQPAGPNMESVPNFGDSFYGITYSSQNVSNVQPSPANSQFLPQELPTSQPETDILADILPPSGPSPAVVSPGAFSSPSGQPAQPSANMYGSFHPQMGSTNPLVAQMPSGSAAQHTSGNFISQGSSPAPVASLPLSFSSPTGQPAQPSAQPSANTYGSFHQQMGSTNPVASNIMPQMPSGSAAQHSNGNFISQGSSTAPSASYMAPQTPAGTAAQFNSGNFLSHQGSGVPSASHAAYQNPSGPATQQANELRSNLLPQAASNTPTASQPAVSSSTGSLAIVPQSQPTKDKFEPKSAVWADTLSRGLVNLNISGPKTNPLADIGVDFDAINRKEKRMEKQPPQTTVTSTVTMGKAMGSGSGLGRAGAGAIRAPPNSMMGSNMGMGMGMGGGPGPGLGMGMGMGGYGGMNQPMGMGMAMGMGMNPGMNMGMGQGVPMQPQTGMMPPGSRMPGGYQPMMGASGYTPQQPYGGGYQ